MANYTVLTLDNNALQDFNLLSEARESVKKWLETDVKEDKEAGMTDYITSPWGYVIRDNNSEAIEEYRLKRLNNGKIVTNVYGTP